MDDWREANRSNWDDRAAVHPETDHYDVEGFLDGASTLHPIERAALGDVSGSDLCHLMCHFGLDTLSWAREGADVVGVDFSGEAIDRARELRDEAGLTDRASFVRADVYDAADVLDREFDVVVATYGVLVWLPDLDEWAEVVADLLAPGGAFLLVDTHPVAEVFAPASRDLRFPYFFAPPVRVDAGETYAGDDVDLDSETSYQWYHPLSDVLGAVLDAGLRVESFDEYPYCHYEKFDGMERDGEWWVFPEREAFERLRDSLGGTEDGEAPQPLTPDVEIPETGEFPLMFSLQARWPPN